MKNILIYIQKSSFVETDIKILKAKEYKYTNPFSQLLYFIFHKYDNYFVWFCDYHALIPILFAWLYRKKSYIFVGGYDCYGHKEGDIKYGVFTSWFRGKIAKICYKMCTKVFPVDKSLVYELKSYIRLDDNKVRVIPTGYDIKFWQRNYSLKQMYDFITVGFINNKTTYWRKGIDRFITLARYNPDKKFLIVGVTYDFPHPKNVKIMPPQHAKTIKRLFSMSEYYCQFSRIEGLPDVLVEAMLCDCIPYVTDFGNIKDLIQGRSMGEIVGYMYPYERFGWHNPLSSARNNVKHLTKTRRKNEILSHL